MDKGVTIMSTVDSKQKAFNSAADKGRIEDVKKYINDDTVDVNWKTDEDGWAALHYACCDGHYEIVELLLNNGADIEVKTGDGDTPLFLACRLGHLSIATFLLDRGAIIDCNLLHQACGRGKVSIVKLLLDRGCTINAVNKCGNTPLHSAFRFCVDTECVVELLNRGADANIKDKDGNTPLLIASSFYSYKDSVAELLAHGADINIKDKDGNTPLHKASYHAHLKKNVSELLAHGANVNIQNKDGDTPLHNASYHDHLKKYVSELLAHGANVNIQNKDGDTPLHRACFSGIDTSVRELLDHGADVAIKNNIGRTPMEVAQYTKQSFITDLLLNSNREKFQRQHVDSVRDAKESIMAEMKVLKSEVAECMIKMTEMEDRLASRFEAMVDRQCAKRLMIADTEMNQSVKKPRIESTLTNGNAPQVEVGGKEDTPMKCGEGTIFSMLNPFRKSWYRS